MTMMCFHSFFCFVSIFSCIVLFVCTFTLEELSSNYYEVDIEETPVKKEIINPLAVHITSQKGQEFQCTLPTLYDEVVSEKMDDAEKGFNVVEMLKPMQSASCLSKSKDWWTYEFCFGRHIKQFHLQDGEIIGEVLTLGLYDSDMNWNNETANEERFKHSKQKYHSQYYTNGTKCDITGKPRTAEVRLFCEEDAFDYMYRVDEPGTCHYVITVYTSRLCFHPFLPLPSNKALPIKCKPVLNDEQYSIYLKKLDEQKALAEETHTKWLAAQQEQLEALKYVKLVNSIKEMPSEEDEAENPSSGNSKTSDSSKARAIKASKQFLRDEYGKEMEKLKASLPSKTFDSLQPDFDRVFNELLDDENQEVESYLKLNPFAQVAFNSILKTILKKMKDVDKSLGLMIRSGVVDILKTTDTVQSRTATVDDVKVEIHSVDLDAIAESSEMDTEQQKKLRIIKEKLEKALKTERPKIKVEVLTGENAKTFQTLTNGESKDFQNLIMALLQQDPTLHINQQEVMQESKRHKKLEKAYNFKWDNEEMENKED